MFITNKILSGDDRIPSLYGFFVEVAVVNVFDNLTFLFSLKLVLDIAVESISAKKKMSLAVLQNTTSCVVMIIPSSTQGFWQVFSFLLIEERQIVQ